MASLTSVLRCWQGSTKLYSKKLQSLWFSTRFDTNVLNAIYKLLHSKALANTSPCETY